jgi:uncharacterized membrane protein YjgN (DUF898 family)
VGGIALALLIVWAWLAMRAAEARRDETAALRGTPRMKAKHQRLVLVIIALVAIVGAGLLAAWALRNQASYFYLPEQMAAERPPRTRAGAAGRDGEAGSIKTRPMA